jgi:hypothetical protein
MTSKNYESNTTINVIDMLLSSSSKNIKNVVFKADKDRLLSAPNIQEIKNLHIWYEMKTDNLNCFPGSLPKWLYLTKKYDDTSDFNLGLILYGNEKRPNQFQNLLDVLNYSTLDNSDDYRISYNFDYSCCYMIKNKQLHVGILKSSCEATDEYCRDFYWNKFVAEKIIESYKSYYNKELTLGNIIFHVDNLYVNPENYNLISQFQLEFNFPFP